MLMVIGGKVVGYGKRQVELDFVEPFAIGE
jgi:hypothetical protein